MPKSKEIDIIENKIASYIETIFNKKMQNIEVDLKQLAIKTSEDYLAKAMQLAVKDIIQHVTRNTANDLMKNMGLNDEQIMSSFSKTFF